MTRDDIIRMAREAGGADITSHGWTSWVGTQSTEFLERFAALVATPPQRKPLTDEQIRDLWAWSASAEAERTASTQQHAFARAIERAHGIKE